MCIVDVKRPRVPIKDEIISELKVTHTEEKQNFYFVNHNMCPRIFVHFSITNPDIEIDQT